MNVAGPNPVLDAVADAARLATGAAAARLVSSDAGALRVAAVAGSLPASAGTAGWHVGEGVPDDEEGVGYAVASAQPYSVAAQDGAGVPMLCVPCLHDSEPIGALQLLGSPGAAPFPIDSTDVAMLFARVAGTAIATDDHSAASVPTPRELAAELARIEASDPIRYTSVARAVGSLLS
jgi:hypothetical protein